MTLNEMNQFLRRVFKNFIQKGFTYKELADCFLDAQCTRRMFEFVEEEKDFSFRSVERVMKSLNYRLFLTPQKKNNNGNPFCEEIFANQAEELLLVYSDFLENRKNGVSYQKKRSKKERTDLTGS